MVLEKNFIELVYGLNRPVYEVTYEDLQLNPTKTINTLLSYLGLPGEKVLSHDERRKIMPLDMKRKDDGSKKLGGGGVSSSNATGSTSSGADGWVKRSSDDLREHIHNFDELIQVLRSMNSPCLEAQLTSKRPGISFPPCPLPHTTFAR
jgi:hypothetical protein